MQSSGHDHPLKPSKLSDRSGATRSGRPDAYSGELLLAELRFGDLGSKLGHGGGKDVYAYGDDLAIGVLQEGKPRDAIAREIQELTKLEELGLPTVRTYGSITVDGRPAMVMDQYAQGSKDVVKTLGKPQVVGQSPFLNERSAADLKAIQDMMIAKKVKVDDLQFLIAKDGRVVIADPAQVHLNTAPSKANKQTIELLIQQAKKHR